MDHEIRLNVLGDAYTLVEVGHTTFGGKMVKAGVGTSLNGLSWVQKNFVFLNVFAQKTISGPSGEHVFGLSWQTIDLKLSDTVSVYWSGFADFQENATNIAQPQVWLKFYNSPIEVGSEISFFGGEKSVSLAVKLKF